MSTWGGLRMQLALSMPGVPLDSWDEFINGRYEQVLEAADWQGVKYHAALQTIAAYQSTSDTVTLTVGSASVAGVGTAWTSAATLGMKLYRPGDTVIYTVAAWGSSNSLTLDRPYEGKGTDLAGVVYAGAAYVLMQNVYALPADVRTVVSLIDPVSGLPLQQMSKEGLDAAAGVRTLVQDPQCWALTDDSTEESPPVAHQVELYPPPMRARGISVEYLHAADGFDGSNTGAGPMPWVSMSVLLYGCRADGHAYLAGQSAEPGPHLQLVKMYEAKFQEELARLLRVEFQQRRPKTALRMADRFTRHRLARSTRGLANNWGIGAGGPD